MQKPSSGSSYSTLRSGTSSARYVLIKSSSFSTSWTSAHTFLRPSIPGSCLRIERHAAENCSRSRFIKITSSGSVSDVVEFGAPGRPDRHHHYTGLVHAAGRHALMCRLDDHGNTLGLQHLVESIGNLRGHLLLDLQALGVDVDEPCEFRDADDPFVRQVGDMHLADDRSDVVLAMRLEADVLQHDDLVVSIGFLKGLLEQRDRVLAIAAEELLVRAHDAVRRADQPLSLGIVARPPDQRTNRLLGLFSGRPPHHSRLPGVRLGRRKGWSDNLRHQVLSWRFGRVRAGAGPPPPRAQLSLTGWCGLSSENAGTRIQKLSPPRVSI